MKQRVLLFHCCEQFWITKTVFVNSNYIRNAWMECSCHWICMFLLFGRKNKCVLSTCGVLMRRWITKQQICKQYYYWTRAWFRIWINYNHSLDVIVDSFRWHKEDTTRRKRQNADHVTSIKLFMLCGVWRLERWKWKN